MTTDIIIHDEKDNVGVVVIDKIIPKQDSNVVFFVMYNDICIHNCVDLFV